MLKELFFVPDIMKRYRCRTPDTARRYMRQMGATGSPLFVTEDMIEQWERTKRRPTAPVAVHRITPIPVGMKIPRRK